MYRDELNGILPLLIFPDESVKQDNNTMKPIYYHPIWNFSIDDTKKAEGVNLIYRKNVYCAKNYLVYCEAIEESKVDYLKGFFKKIVIIIVIPEEMNYEQKIFLKSAIEVIIKNFKSHFTKIVKSEILKLDIIKIPKNENIIKEGNTLKEKIRKLLKTIFI